MFRKIGFLNLDYEFLKKQFVYWNSFFKYHKETPEDDIMPNIPRYFMNYLAEFHIGDLVHKDDFLKLWWSANYTAEYYYGWKISSRQDRKIPSSFSQDVGVEYSIWDNKLAWSFEVDNLMDRTVYDNYGESKPGRTFATKIRFSFK